MKKHYILFFLFFTATQAHLKTTFLLPDINKGKSQKTNSCTNSSKKAYSLKKNYALVFPQATIKNVSCNGGNDGAISLDALESLAGSFTSDNSGGGISFDVTLNKTLKITGLDLNLATSGTIQFYYRSGTGIGNESNSSGWIFVEQASLTSAGINNPTKFNFTIPLSLAAGNYSFYIVAYNGMRYLNGSSTSNVWKSNADISIYEGTGRSLVPAGNEFGLPPITARKFSGNINYESVTYTYAWSNGASTKNISGLTAGSYTCNISGSDGSFASKTFAISQPGIATLLPGTATNPTCSGADGSITFTTSNLPNGPYTLNYSRNSTTASAGIIISSNTFTLSGLNSGTYDSFSVSNSMCTVSTVVSKILSDPLSSGGSVTGGSTVCPGSPSTILTLTGHSGTIIKWQSSTTPFTIWTDILNTNTTYISTPLTQRTQFRAVVQNGACPTANSLFTTVDVSDTTQPVADLPMLPTINAQCSVSSITAPTATDNCKGTVTGTTTTTFPITSSTTVVWTYSDGINTSTQNQTVTIADTTAPIADAATLPTVNAQCSVPSITAPTATDNCKGTVTGTTTTTFPITSSTTVVWTYSDGINTSTQNQIVTIADTAAPVADLATLPTVNAQCSVASITAPTATDNCKGTLTGTTTTIFPITTSTTVVWTYSDGINTSTQNQTVTIADTTAPVADLAALPTVNAQCNVASVVAPTATDNCKGIVTGTTTTTFPITTSTTVVWTYSDGINTSTQNQTVSIADTTAPVADLATLLTVNAQCSVASITAPTATDNCKGIVTGTTTTTFPITSSTTVVWTYSDGINTSTQNQTVTIADTTAPIANLATLAAVNAQCSVASIVAPTATDNCKGTLTGTTTTTFPITSSTTVVWTYSDGINTSTQNQTVTIADTTAPIADAATLPTVNAQCSVASIVAPTATDNCKGTITGTTTTVFPITSSTTIVWTYSDGINTSTQNQTVTIADTTAPVANLGTLPTVNAQCSVASITAPTATDNCKGTLTGTTTTTFPITTSTTVVWTYSDGINTSTQNQTVTIADTTAPVANLATLPTVNAQCSVASITAPTATDNCKGMVTGTTTTTFPITSSMTVVWTYSDGINTSTQNQTVTIADTTAPIADAATLPTVNAQCNVVSIVAPTATDNCKGTITGTTTTVFPITTSTTVVWTYSDGINTSTQNQTVTIADTTAPIADVATLPTVNAQCNVASIFAPTATDNCKGTITGTTTRTFPITSSTTVVWTYSDGINTSTQNQTVTIADTTAPVADLATLSTVNAQCSVASITAPTATDNCKGTITGTTTTVFPITTSTTVVWTYSDGINTSTQNQTVTIADTTAPVADLATLPAVNAQCSVATITAPTATDNCKGTLTGTTTATFPITSSTTVVWTYSDGINTSTQNQTITIADTTAPVADLATLPAVNAQCNVASIVAPTATDNCKGTLTGTTTMTFPITSSTTVVWTYSDGINTSTQSQTVTIADTMAPVANLATLPTVNAQCSVASITVPTATDNCKGNITGTTTTVFPITSSATVVWTYSDGINTSTQNQTVTIADTTAPVADLATLQTVNAQCNVASIVAPTATDNCKGIVTGTTTTTFPITSSTTVVWTYSDGINTSTQNQTVTIADTTAPVANLATLPTVNAQCNVTSITAPTATDNCKGIVTGTTTTVFPITTSTTVVWTYSDGINTSTQNQTVTIADTTAPVANLATLPTVNAQCSVASITAPTATDNCKGIVTGTTTTTFPITSSTTVIWTYSDGINTSTQNQTVTIADTTNPTLTCISNQTLPCGEKTVPDYRSLISVSDNCDPAVNVTQSPVPGTSFSGEIVVEITAKDKSGNSSKCDFKVFEKLVLADAGSDLYIKEGETIQLEAIATEAGSFKWNTAEGLSNLLIANPFANPSETTTYTVVFRSTEGCVTEDSITVFVEPDLKDDTKYGFSPNNDGINDFWEIDTIEKYPDNEVSIYNRWGDLVFQIKNYDNATNVFGGIANSKRNLGADMLPEGTYFFDIQIKGAHHLKKTKGFLVLKR